MHRTGRVHRDGDAESGTSWDINALSYNSSTGTVTGTFADDGDGSPSGQVDFTFMFTSVLGTCTIEATGTWNITFTNSTGVIAVTSASLIVISATGGAACLGIDAGDPVNFSTGTGGYNVVNSGGGHPVITSP